VETNAPVCSKSIKFLKDNGIGVETVAEKWTLILPYQIP
jgi:hypothetical protein